VVYEGVAIGFQVEGQRVARDYAMVGSGVEGDHAVDR
jgi:hypothetical protein